MPISTHQVRRSCLQPGVEKWCQANNDELCNGKIVDIVKKMFGHSRSNESWFSISSGQKCKENDSSYLNYALPVFKRV